MIHPPFELLELDMPLSPCEVVKWMSPLKPLVVTLERSRLERLFIPPASEFAVHITVELDTVSTSARVVCVILSSCRVSFEYEKPGIDWS